MSFRLSDRVMLHALRTSKIRGVQLAIVVDNKDGAGNPGYRVKVKFPWLNEQETSFWARIVVPMGGSDRGTYMLPEIDDQVLVVFEHGNINRPIVIGGLWSKKQDPVEVNQSGKNNTKLIKSRAGHRIIFDDKEGAEKITIVDKTKKNKIILDSVNKIVKIESDGDIDVIAKTDVIMHSNALKIGTSDGVTGKGASLLIHSSKTLGLKATSGITIGGGNTTINVSNAAATSVSGSGTGELGGAATEQPKDQVTESGGGGSSRRFGASAAAAVGGPVNAIAATSEAPPPAASGPYWTEFRFRDSGKRAIKARYRITLPDGKQDKGSLDAEGSLRREQLTQGSSRVDLVDIEDAAWGSAEHDAHLPVDLRIVTTGLDAGEPVTFEVFRLYRERAGDPVATLQATIDGDGRASARWTPASIASPEDSFVFRASAGGTWRKAAPMVVHHHASKAAWSSTEACDGDTITLTATMRGVRDGEHATIVILCKDWRGGRDAELARLDAPVSDGEVSTNWTITGQTGAAARGGVARRDLYFTVQTDALDCCSGLLNVLPRRQRS